MIYIIYRDKKSNHILSYSIYKKAVDNLDEKISQYNNSNPDKLAEKTDSQDIISMIEIAEENQKTKQHDLRRIEDAFDNLQIEIYQLKESLNL